MIWQNATLFIAGLAAWVGSLLQCRLAAHQYADEIELHEHLTKSPDPWTVAIKLMFRIPKRLEDASDAEKALQNAQGWFWVNFGSGLVVGTGVGSVLWNELGVATLVTAISLAITISFLRGRV